MPRYHNTTGITCATCSSEEFDEDDGTLICIYCGTLSQDIIAESNDREDTGDVFGLASGGRRVSLFVPKYRHPKSTMTYDSDIHDLLLKSLWMSYLDQWRRCQSGCDMRSFFSKQLKCQCQPPNYQHPHFISRPLMLAFLYITIRLERYDILPADLVRWCERGLLPYVTIWEHFPESIQSRVNRRYRWIFLQNHTGRTKFVTPMNIWFHSCQLAKELDVILPPLNTPAVARGMIVSLGLPPLVWIRYCQICRHYLDGKTLDGLEAVGQMHGSRVMAGVLLALQLCENWQDWSLFYHSNSSSKKKSPEDEEEEEERSRVAKEEEMEAVPMPYTLDEMRRLNRQEILTLIVQLRQMILHYRTTEKEKHLVPSSGQETYAYNQVILRLLSLKLKENSNGSSQGGGNESSQRGELSRLIMNYEGNEKLDSRQGFFPELSPWRDVTPIEDKIKRAPEFLSGHSIGYENSKVMKRRYERKLKSTAIDNHQRSEGHVPYVSYIRHADDMTGTFSMAYVTLLERVARHYYLEPLTVHRLLEVFDAQIVEMATEGRVNHDFNILSFLNKRHILLQRANRMSAEEKIPRMDKKKQRIIRSFKKMRDREGRVLPLAEKLGIHDRLQEANSTYADHSIEYLIRAGIVSAGRYHNSERHENVWEDHLDDEDEEEWMDNVMDVIAEEGNKNDVLEALQSVKKDGEDIDKMEGLKEPQEAEGNDDNSDSSSENGSEEEDSDSGSISSGEASGSSEEEEESESESDSATGGNGDGSESAGDGYDRDREDGNDDNEFRAGASSDESTSKVSEVDYDENISLRRR
eukprot:gene6757-7467_t